MEAKDSAIFKSLSFICEQKRRQDILIATLSKDEPSKQIGELLTANGHLKKKIEDENRTFDEQKEEITSLKDEVGSLKKSLKLLKDGYIELKGRYERIQEESRVKNQNIEGINDGILSLQIENNLLHKTIDKLKKENKTLVDRWMDKASKDADVLNDANEVLKESKKSNGN